MLNIARKARDMDALNVARVEELIVRFHMAQTQEEKKKIADLLDGVKVVVADEFKALNGRMRSCESTPR